MFYFFNFYCYSIRVVCLFSPSLHPTPAKPTSITHLHPPPSFCPCVLYSSSCNPLSLLSPPHFRLAILRLFLTSVSLVIFCLLFSSVDYVPVKVRSYGTYSVLHNVLEGALVCSMRQQKRHLFSSLNFVT